MQIINQNPYRVIGSLANATERELQKKIGIIKRFAEVGKDKGFEHDFSFIGDLSRDLDDVSHAASKIEQSHKKIFYSLFWFINKNNFDDIVLSNLKDKNIDKAISVWDRTLKEGISSTNYSSYHNLSTLYISLSLSDGQLDMKHLDKGIELKGRLIHSEYFSSFTELVAGTGVLADADDTSKLFVDEIISNLTQFIDVYNGFNVNKVISLFDSYPENIRKYVINKFTGPIILSIEGLIEDAEVKREAEPTKASAFGENLFKETKKDINTLKAILDDSHIQLEMIVNKLAGEILQCSIAYYNELYDSDGIDPGSNALRIAKYAKSIGPTGQTKNRIAENIEVMQEWVDDKPIRDEQGKVEHDVAHITKLLQEFQEKRETVYACNTFLKDCNLSLINIKEHLGSDDKFYLEISSAVAINASGMLVSIFNGEQEDVIKNRSALAAFKITVPSINQSFTKVMSLDMTQDCRKKIGLNSLAILATQVQLDEHTNKSSEGCYIATMAYGDYSHPQVILLRQYRDNKLAKTLFGRGFIKVYYLISPILVNVLKNQNVINIAIRKILNNIIRVVK